MVKTLFSRTDPGFNYPAFINVREDTHSTGFIIGIRDHAETVSNENGTHFACGPVVEKHLSTEELLELANRIQEHLGFSAIAIVEKEKPDLLLQISKLARFIMTEFAQEPSQNEGAVDTAIRLLRRYARAYRDYIAVFKTLPRLTNETPAVGHIASGLRAGQAEHVHGETQDTTIETGYVSVDDKQLLTAESEDDESPSHYIGLDRSSNDPGDSCECDLCNTHLSTMPLRDRL